MAGLRDAGWIVIPEPGATLMLGTAASYLLSRRRRRSSTRVV
ncbi:MAG: PEP-CTERM sorting domain-containing protein [Chthoniobacteraceae bacterium]